MKASQIQHKPYFFFSTISPLSAQWPQHRSFHLHHILSSSHLLCAQVLRTFLKKDCLRKSSRAIQSSIQSHVEQACKLAWNFIITCPPMIISHPSNFSEDWHDREFQYWDKRVQRSKLYYTRPVLFRSFEGGIGMKGWVGNTPDTIQKTQPHNSLTKGFRRRSWATIPLSWVYKM